MPAIYAHYRLGQTLHEMLPADARKAVNHFPRLFQVGLQGPDIFFYHNLQPGTAFLGIRLHEQSGVDFFTRARKIVKTEADRAYLYGLLIHYCLDATFHPFIKEQTIGGKRLHSRMEAEFDRFLLVQDGKFPPNAAALTEHLRLTQGESETVARFYPQVSARAVRKAVEHMRCFCENLLNFSSLQGKLLKIGLRLMGKNIAGMQLSATADPDYTYLNPVMENLYQQAAQQFVLLAPQLADNDPLGKEFSLPFG